MCVCNGEKGMVWVVGDRAPRPSSTLARALACPPWAAQTGNAPRARRAGEVRPRGRAVAHTVRGLARVPPFSAVQSPELQVSLF